MFNYIYILIIENSFNLDLRVPCGVQILPTIIKTQTANRAKISKSGPQRHLLVAVM